MDWSPSTNAPMAGTEPSDANIGIFSSPVANDEGNRLQALFHSLITPCQRFIGGFRFEAEQLGLPSTTDEVSELEIPQFPVPQMHLKPLTGEIIGLDGGKVQLQINSHHSIRNLTGDFDDLVLSSSSAERSNSQQSVPQLQPATPVNPAHFTHKTPHLTVNLPEAVPSPLSGGYREVGSHNGRMAAEKRRSPAVHRKLYTCELCSANFTRAKNLTYHRYSHYNIRNYRCEWCQMSFGTNHTLKRHKVKKHPQM